MSVDRNGAEVARFTYDPIGRRIQKVVGAVTHAWLYDGEDILREFDGASTFKFVHGPGIDEPLSRETDVNPTIYAHVDGLGSLVKATGGQTTFTRKYDAFGNMEQGAAAASYAFTGREWDPETGLYYYRARYYDPKIGRFISEDPIGWLGGINLYTYAADDPVNLVDPSGLAGVRVSLPPSPVLLCWEEAGGAAGAMFGEYLLMRQAFTRNADKYFHCLANCEASRYGPCGVFASQLISSLREPIDWMTGDPISDSMTDMSANSVGRNCPAKRSCEDQCRPYLPPRLPPAFPRRE